jgi:glycosyltransferase involved in cell wall biosynthesis
MSSRAGTLVLARDRTPGTVIAQLIAVAARIPLAIVLTSFDPGGTERQMTELICRLDQTQFEVHVACLRREGRWLSKIEPVASSIGCFPLTSFRSPSAAREIGRFVGWCHTRRLAVVHACDFYANVFALTGAALARVPIRIGARRDILLPERSPAQHRLQALSYRWAHHVVANSHAAAAQLVREGVDSARINVIPNGIDLEQYVPGATRTSRHVVTTVANLRLEKGHEVLIRAAALIAREIPDLVVQLVGAGAMREALLGQIDALRLTKVVRLLGDREDVPDVLDRTGIFVLPSRTEAFPNSVMEAMAMRLPVVASDVGGIPELIEHGRNGVLVPPGDERALAAAVLDLFRNPARASRLAASARATIEARYSFERMVREFEVLYRGEPGHALPVEAAS